MQRVKDNLKFQICVSRSFLYWDKDFQVFNMVIIFKGKNAQLRARDTQKYLMPLVNEHGQNCY